MGRTQKKLEEWKDLRVILKIELETRDLTLLPPSEGLHFG